MKLDRNPATMQAIENARNTILARAYMDPIVSGLPKPTENDVHKFYVEHPELFSSRQVYSMRELEVEAKPELVASIRDQVSKGEKLEAIAAWIKGKDIAAAIHSGVKPAEQIPSEMLLAFGKLSEGQLMVVEQNKSISVLQIVSRKLEPVNESTASAAILGYLGNSRSKDAIDKEIKNLKAGAKIEYIGDTDAKPVAAVAPEKVVAQHNAPDVAKGVAGLK